MLKKGFKKVLNEMKELISPFIVDGGPLKALGGATIRRTKSEAALKYR